MVILIHTIIFFSKLNLKFKQVFNSQKWVSGKLSLEMNSCYALTLPNICISLQETR